MRNYLLLFCFLSLNLVSCGPTSLVNHNVTEIEKARNHWVGETQNTLIISWGPPTSKTSDGDGGEIYSYRRGNGFSTWVTNFYMGSTGIIYHLNAHSE